jgi:TolB-like protein/Flp pilus assembly protein TadD
VNPESLVTDPAAVRAALARILATGHFQQSEAQARLLRRAVEETLAGRRCKLKNAPAAKLRARLAEYYAAEGLRDPVRIELPMDDSAAVFSVAAPLPRPARRLWLWLALALAGAVLLIWAGSWWRARTASAQVRSLAVLPFVDLTPRKNDEWFAASFTGEIIDSLDRAPGLRVAARTSAFRVKGNAGRQLGVEAVIEGDIRRSGDRLRIGLQMNRTSDGYHLWSANFDLPTQDLPAAQHAIATAIAGRLQIHLPAPLPHRHRPQPRAYNAYLQGRSSFDRSNPEALNKAAERLEESIRIDADFALAWAWLSIVREYRVAAGMARPNQAMPASRDAAERAVALDPDCGEAHLALGIVKLQYDWDWAAAKEELDRTLEASPGSAFALEWRAHWYEAQGRMNEAISEMERARALDPLSGVILGEIADQYVSLSQPERALPFAQKAVDLNPDEVAPRSALAEVLLLAGQKEKSRQIVEQPRNPAGAKLPANVLASLAAQLGDPATARQLLNQAEDLPDEELLPAVAYAGLAGAVHDWDRLFSWTEEAYGERDVQLPYLRMSPLMPAADPRFAAFLARMNLPASPAR